MSDQPDGTERWFPWIGLVVVVVLLITTSWGLGWERAGIGIAAVLIALWDARN